MSPQVNPHEPSELALLEQAALTVSKVGESAVDIAEIAELVAVSEQTARELFPTNEDLLSALRVFLNSRFEAYVNEKLRQLPDATTALEKLVAVAYGYFNFCQAEKHHFGAFIALTTTSRTEGFDADFAALSDRPSFQLIMNLTRQAIIEAGGPRDEWVLVSCAATVFATMHGYCHLAAFGIIRYLTDAAKKQTLQAVMHTLIAGVRPILSEGFNHRILPTNYVGPIDFPQPASAAEMPKTTDEETKKALWRAAIEQTNDGGLSTVTLYRAAERAQVEHSEALRLLDGDENLLRSLENHLDETDQGFIGAQCFLVEEGSPAVSYLKASGYGYVAYALSDPEAFITLIAVSSGSFVPVSFDENTDMNEMDVAFNFLMNLTRQAIEEGGGSGTAWDLYSQTLGLWSTAHGLAHLFSAGALRHLPADQKFAILGPSLDIIFKGVINAMELDDSHWNLVDTDPQDIPAFLQRG